MLVVPLPETLFVYSLVDSFDGPQTLLLFSVNIGVDGQPPCWSSFVASISAGLSIFCQRR